MGPVVVGPDVLYRGPTLYDPASGKVRIVESLEQQETQENRSGANTPSTPSLQKRRKDRDTSQWMLQQAGGYGFVGLEFGVVLIAGYFIGQWLDEYFQMAPYLTYACLLLGFATAFRDLFRLIRRVKFDED